MRLVPTASTGGPPAEGGEASQGHLTYLQMLEEIRAGRLAPGARLRETELAARLGTSRTPVREAIRLLEADGLVVHVPRLGASVRRLDHAEVTELYEMRAVLEGMAARLAARAASDVELAELAALHAEIAGVADDPALAARLNRDFHAMLLGAARNRHLTRAMDGLQRALMILGPSTLAAPERSAEAIAEHAQVLAALTARDGAAAEAAMRRHIEGAHRQRLRQLRSRPQDEEEGGE